MSKAPSRLLVGVTLTSLALTAGLFLALAGEGRPSASAIAKERQLVEQLLGIAIVPLAKPLAGDSQASPLAATPATAREVDRYLPLLCRELRKYPRELMACMRLQRVVLCRDLGYGGQPRAAVPMFGSDVLYLDVVAGDYSRNYQRIVVHHELMHVIDYRDDGKLFEDASWTALNAPDFRYGNGGVNAQDDAQASLHTTRFPGFLTSYSTAGVEEDKAELFARLMVEPGYVDTRAEHDEILRAKVVRLKGLLAAFCPEFDEGVWPTSAPRVLK